MPVQADARAVVPVQPGWDAGSDKVAVPVVANALRIACAETGGFGCLGWDANGSRR